jgi:hypothetical protein
MLIFDNPMHQDPARSRSLLRFGLFTYAKLYVNRVAYKYRFAPLASQFDQCKSGAVHQTIDGHARGQPRSDRQGKHAVGSTLPKWVFGSINRVRMQGIEIAREAGELNNIGFGYGTTRAGPALTLLKIVKIKTSTQMFVQIEWRVHA